MTTEQGTTDAHFGLFSIRERMEAIEGTVEITSMPNQGTTASLKLSLAPPAETATQSDKTLRVSTAKSAKTPDVRILMVDDHPLVRQGMRGVMDGFQNMHIVGEAADGREAVQLAQSLRPDVVIMDVNMPNMDGVEATRLIKQSCPEITVIGLSIHNDRQIDAAMKEAGAASFVTKDAAPEQLYSAISAALVRKLTDK